MATLVLLGGNNIKNKRWIQKVNQTLLPFYDTTHIHFYRHRDKEGKNMDIEYECEQLYEYLKGITGSIIIFCKSLGCLLALKLMVEKEIFIKQSIFVGFPLGYTELHAFPIEKYIKELTSPILWIQHTNDPAGGYTTIAEKLGSISPAFTCEDIPGETHDYPEINILQKIILKNNAT